jgi:hypothetical protein
MIPIPRLPAAIQTNADGSEMVKNFMNRKKPKKQILVVKNASVHGKGVSMSLSFIDTISKHK